MKRGWLIVGCIGLVVITTSAYAEPSIEMMKLRRASEMSSESFRVDDQAQSGKRAFQGNIATSESAGDTGIFRTGIKMFEGLGICLGIFLIGVHYYRRYCGVPKKVMTRRIRIVERVPVSSKTSLVLVEINGRTILTAVGPERVTFEECGCALEQEEVHVLKHETSGLCERELKLSAL